VVVLFFMLVVFHEALHGQGGDEMRDGIFRALLYALADSKRTRESWHGLSLGKAKMPDTFGIGKHSHLLHMQVGIFCSLILHNTVQFS